MLKLKLQYFGHLMGQTDSFEKALMELPWWLSGTEFACNAGASGDPGLIPGSGRSPGEENNNPLQYSYLENPMDKGAWQARVHGVTRVRHDLATE